jgi:hemolysin activation/secretion protein
MRNIFQRVFYLTAIITLFAISAVWAAPPDAGQLMREQEPQRQLPTQLPKPEAQKERAAMGDSGISVNVKSFKFTGYEGLVGESELQSLVTEAVGKKLTFNELQGLVSKVTSYLKDKGWFLARAYLPKQDVTSGDIEIAILQGTSDGTLIIKRDPSARIDEGVLRNIGSKAVSPGQALSEQQLERSVLLMNDLSGVNARASLAPGATAGSTAVQIDVSEGPIFSGSVWGDNYGNRYTGAWRGNGMINLNDPLRYGDQLSMMVTGAEGLIQGRATYLAPLLPCGLRANLSYTGMYYELIDDMSSLDMDGWSQTLDAGFSYPILRSRKLNLTTTLGYELKLLRDRSSDVDLYDKVLNSGILGFHGDEYDTLLGGGYTTFNVGATLGDMAENEADISITEVEGTYTHFNFGVARLQRLLQGLTINASYNGQLSLDNLDSSEKIILGGPYGVRAYPVGEAPGDSGHLFNVDLRYDLPVSSTWGMFQLSGFYDAGHITLHHDAWLNSINTATGENEYWLQGAGVGILYIYKNIFSLKGSWAHVLGDNPGRSTEGDNADGRDDEYRFWLQAALYF